MEAIWSPVSQCTNNPTSRCPPSVFVSASKDIQKRRTYILVEPITMETATTISRRTDYNQRHIAKTPAITSASRPDDSAKRYTHMVVIPFLILVYIFNGSHDPKKVHWLNIILSTVFLGAGIIFNQDFLSVGTMFLAIALTNIASVWIVQNFGMGVESPAIGEILSQLHVSVRYHPER
jgi:hypothetical protein